MIKIDKNIEKPRHAYNKYPFADMQIGDSFAVNRVDYSGINAFRNSTYIAGRRLGVKFSTLKTESGYRCWRIE